MEHKKPTRFFCQSCSMQMRKAEEFGTEADGDQTELYCKHCYQNGAFTEPDITIEQMIEKVAGFMMTHMNATEEQAQEMAKRVIPKLQRWRES